MKWLFAGLLMVSPLMGAEPLKTERILFVMTDGLRPHEVFGGADPALFNKEHGGIRLSETEAVKKEFDGAMPEERRVRVMPFVWTTIAKEGQLFGNQKLGSSVRVTNGMNFSYPGYNEILTGAADPRINSNKKILNQNFTVLEWLGKKPRIAGSVAAFGAWDTFPWIFNRERCGFLVNAGYEPLLELEGNAQVAFLNELKKKDKFPYWQNGPFDPLTFRTAVEYFKAKKPKIFFLSLNETDEWAHAGRYDEYLAAARRVDGYLKTLWEIVQGDPEMRGKTTLIFSTDHGRGEAPIEWKSHGAEYKGSENMWLMVMGPDTPALGERKNVPLIGQNQVAATLARFLGEDYRAAFPQAGAAIEEVFLKAVGKP